MHYDIECFYNGIIPENNSKEYHYFQNFHNDHKNLKPYRTEWMIYHVPLKLAGSIDFVVLNDDGSLDILDWKRCKDIKKYSPWDKYAITSEIDYVPDTNYWHYSLQLNTYKYILEDQYEKKVKNMYLICLHPDNDGYQKIKVPDMQNEIRQLMKNRINSLNI
jgi:ATP-dependent exoDNAse (exonuclease V) beta subunit